jgi:outer membrane receptor protein involved in Fe transport
MRRPVFVIAALLTAAPLLHAVPAGVVLGSVRTADGTPVPNLVLIVRGAGGARTVVTGPEGRYRVPGLEAGHYGITLRTAGFLFAGPSEVDVADRETALDLVLAPAPVRERIVVAATRDEAAVSTVGVSATVLDSERIEEREAPSVLALLEEVPGVAVARNGGIGLQGSVFVRGGESNFTRIMVDGIPVNEPGGEYNLGPQVPLELDRLEVVRGATSSLYGTDALAGVIHLVTRRYPSAPSWRAEGQGGSFGWWRGEAGSAGKAGRFDWNAGLVDLRTDNEQPNSELRLDGVAASLGFELGPATALRVTVRGEDTEVGTPGSTAFGRPDLDARFERQTAVAGAALRHTSGGSRTSCVPATRGRTGPRSTRSIPVPTSRAPATSSVLIPSPTSPTRSGSSRTRGGSPAATRWRRRSADATSSLPARMSSARRARSARGRSLSSTPSAPTSEATCRTGSSSAAVSS